MKRFLSVFFLSFLILSIHTKVYADSVTDNIVMPGINCGVAEDTDLNKRKCCATDKKDGSAVQEIANGVNGLPVVGGYFGGVSDKFNAINAEQEKMEPCVYGIPSTPLKLDDPDCFCFKEASTSAVPALNKFCDKYFVNSVERLRCLQCIETRAGFYTAIGCIPLELSAFITDYLLTIGIGIAGGVALLCIFYSAFRMQTSMGNAEAIKKAQENLTACITGLVIIIFSVLILKIMGVDILGIPSFTK